MYQEMLSIMKPLAIMVRVTAECHIHVFLMIETGLIMVFVGLCFLARMNHLNPVSIAGLSAFALSTIAIAFVARCPICTIFIVINVVLLIVALVAFAIQTKKIKDTKKE